MKECDTIDTIEDIKKMKQADFAFGEFLRASPRKKNIFVVPENEVMSFKSKKELVHEKEDLTLNDEEKGDASCIDTAGVQDIVNSLNQIATDTQQGSNWNLAAIATSKQNNLVSCGQEFMNLSTSHQHQNTNTLLENQSKPIPTPCSELTQKTKLPSQPKHLGYHYQNLTPQSNSETLNLTITHHMVSSTRQITIPHHSDIPTQIGAEQTHIINSYEEAQKGNIIGVSVTTFTISCKFSAC